MTKGEHILLIGEDVLLVGEQDLLGGENVFLRRGEHGEDVFSGRGERVLGMEETVGHRAARCLDGL